MKNNEGNTPLHIAAKHGFVDGMKFLMDGGDMESIYERNNDGKTFLDVIENELLRKEMEEYVNVLCDTYIKEPDEL